MLAIPSPKSGRGGGNPGEILNSECSMAPVPIETENNYNCGGDEGPGVKIPNNQENGGGLRRAITREVPVKQSM
jgi:hypothetical protein